MLLLPEVKQMPSLGFKVVADRLTEESRRPPTPPTLILPSIREYTVGIRIATLARFQFRSNKIARATCEFLAAA